MEPHSLLKQNKALKMLKISMCFTFPQKKLPFHSKITNLISADMMTFPLLLCCHTDTAANTPFFLATSEIGEYWSGLIRTRQAHRG